MISTVVVDSGPLLAVANSADPDNAACREILEDTSFRLVIPALCVAEVTYLLGRRFGPKPEALFLRALEPYDVRAPSSDQWPRIADLVDRYSDLPLGGTDASVVALAEDLETDLIATLDHRHFSVVRNRDGGSFRLFP